MDVDGDGRADTAWVQNHGPFVVGITTATGATFSAPYSSPSAVPSSVLVADVDGAGTIAAIVDDARQPLLFAVVRCSLVPALNPQGEQYHFSLFGGGSIGCLTVAGSSGPGLVRLMSKQDGAGNPTTVTRTAVRLRGATASDGVSDTVDVSTDPTGPTATATREFVSCGDQTMKANGVG